MTACALTAEELDDLVRSGAVGFRRAEPESGTRRREVERTGRRDRERERGRLKRLAFIQKGLTCQGKRRTRKVYEPRTGLTEAQLEEIRRMDGIKHQLKVVGRKVMAQKADWHERLAGMLSRVLAGDYDGDRTGKTWRGTRRKRAANRPRKMAAVEVAELRKAAQMKRNLHYYGRQVMADRAAWHLDLAGRMRRVMAGEQRGRD